MVPTPEQPFAVALRRAGEDARFRSAYEAAYDGGLSPLDALWWAAQPESPTAAGDPSPFAGLSALRRRIYGPDAEPAARDEYERRSAALAGERDAVERAVRAADLRVSGRRRSASGGAASGGMAFDGLRRAASAFRPTRAFVVLLIVVLIAGTATGAGASTLVRARSADAQRTAPGTLLALPASARAAHATLQIFDRKQVLQDRSAGQMGSTLLRSTARRLATDGPTGTTAYAIRDVEGDVCLLMSRSVTAASCVPPAVFARSGIEVHWTEVVTQVNDSGLVQVDAVWQPNGDVFIRAQL